MVILFSQLYYLRSSNDFALHQQVYLLYLSQSEVLFLGPVAAVASAPLL
jgi:hypothetical protein